MNLDILNKFAKNRIFSVGSFQYKFIYAHSNNDKKFYHFEWIPNRLPQSYVYRKLQGDCQEILINIQKYFGSIAVPDWSNITVTVDGKDLKNCFIKNSSMIEIIENLNTNQMTDEKKLTEGMVVDVTWSWDKNPYNFVGEYLNFNLSIDITSITYKGKKVVPKKSYGEARAYLQDLLYDEYLQENADYVISVAIEPDLAFSGLDYYISTSFTIKNLLGKKTDYNGGYDTSFWANFKVVD